MTRVYGEFSHELMVDALVGSDAELTPEILARLTETGFMVVAHGQPLWVREKLEDLGTDTLSAVYVSLKNMKVPNALS